MKNKESASGLIRSVAIDLGPSVFHAVICEQQGQSKTIRPLTVKWRNEATTLHSELGRAELSSALQKFAREENLQGQSVSVVLEGEFCITRHVRGSEQAVEDSLSDLETRSARYLLLGQGTKVAARLIQQSEDQPGQGLLTVANIKTINALVAAASSAGLEITSVGSSLVMVAQLMERLYEDSSGGLVVRPREGGADLAIVDHGQLLLDARPPKKMDNDELSDYIGGRFALLERYFARYALTESRDLQRIFVLGDSQTVDLFTQKFSCRGLLVDSLDRRMAEMPWAPKAASNLFHYSGAIAAVFGELTTSEPLQGPDLLSALDKRSEQSIRLCLFKTLWPLAAAVLLCIGFHTMQSQEQSKAMLFADDICEFEEYETQKWDREDELDALTREIEYLTNIQGQLVESNFDSLLTTIAGCLPMESELASISVLGDGKIWLNGHSGSEDSVYEFVENLKRLPVFRDVALSGTRSERTSEIPNVEFDVEAHVETKTVVAAKGAPNA